MAAPFQSQFHPSCKPLTQERLKELFRYDPETGDFFYKTNRGSRVVGAKAGTMSNGYLVIRVDCILYRAHRLAWLYIHGEWPPDQIDHRNLVRSENKLNNLRPATDLQNRGNLSKRRNNTSGFKGVTYCDEQGRRRRWQAQITVNYKLMNLGRFFTREEAHAAYCRGSQKTLRRVCEDRMTYSLTWLSSVLRAAGLKVEEVDGWELRGHGDVGAIKGVLLHHTAGPRSGNISDLRTLIDGRGQPNPLAGPLCNLGLARDGSWHVIAAGRAYHAGAGLWQGVHDGNSQLVGIEMENTGLSDDNPWPDSQMQSAIKGAAAFLSHVHAAPIMCCAHLEYALPIGRKSDPSFSVGNRNERIKAMVAFRAKVALAMNQPAPLFVAHLPDGTEDAKWLQHSLNDLGAKPPLTVDGHVGPKTAAAIRQFQISTKMNQTGTADFATLAALHDAIGHHEGCACTA